MGADFHSAFLADTAFVVTKGKDPKDSKSLKPASEKNEKRSSSAMSDKHCYACEIAGYG
jgi:hypothetical protein